MLPQRYESISRMLLILLLLMHLSRSPSQHCSLVLNMELRDMQALIPINPTILQTLVISRRCLCFLEVWGGTEVVGCAVFDVHKIKICF